MRTAAFLLLSLLASQALSRAAAPVKDEKKSSPTKGQIDKAQESIEKELKALKAQGAAIKTLSEGSVGESFADHIVFAVTFRQFPVARPVPEPLKGANLYFVPIKEGKPILINTEADLEKFFKDHLKPARDADSMKRSAQTWLTLSPNLHNDGFLQFAIEEDSLKVENAKEGKTVHGKATISGGGNGSIKAAMVFDAEGKLQSVKDTISIKPGVRPICQSTKLLDPDPIVRAMAEQDLLVMGRNALPYLEEQREKAKPELREAMDKIRAKILSEK